MQNGRDVLVYFKFRLSEYGQTFWINDVYNIFYYFTDIVTFDDFIGISVYYGSSGQGRTACGHIMALHDQIIHCARCRDKGQVNKLCVLQQENSGFLNINIVRDSEITDL